MKASHYKQKSDSINQKTSSRKSITEIVQNQGYSIIVLNDAEGAVKKGHTAMLLGSEQEGWTYYSKDGPASWLFPAGASAYTIQTYKSLAEYSADAKRNRYETAIQFRFSDAGIKDQGQQQKMYQTVDNTVRKALASNYHVEHRNCMDAVSESLHKLGFNPGSYEQSEYEKLMGKEKDTVSSFIYDGEVFIMNTMPNYRMNKILARNPNAKDISNQI
ncbi:MAG: hypothetical protein MK066_08160 [Crocinitomicaceae bacterium]|nr:hypothetical protein [Crocinitomicaceae bacterium]